MHVTDMTHFAGVDEFLEKRYAVARGFAHYLGAVVGAGTANPPGWVIPTALSCRRHPGHRPCPGRLLVRRSEAPAQIGWACPACGEGGVISNWHGSIWDLSPALAPDGEVWTVILEPEHYMWLLELRLLDVDCQRIVHAARMTNHGVALAAGEEDLDKLLGSVAAEANHEPNRRRRRGLDEVAGLLVTALSAC